MLQSTTRRLLAVALLTATTTALAPAQSTPARPMPGASLRSLVGQRTVSPAATPVRLRTTPSTVAFIQRVSVPPPVQAGPGGVTGAGAPGFTGLLYRMFVPATGFDELFALHVPGTAAGAPRPLLVGFHGFGTSHLDLYFNARELMDAAVARDWFFLAPFQVNPATSSAAAAPYVDPSFSFASAESQVHVEALLEFVLSQWSVDRDRIYGFGFSMGGGNALSYAARHRDRERGAFAAVVNHTGTVSVSSVWHNNPPSATCSPSQPNSTRPKMLLTFGGPPPSFEYQRSSLIDLDATGQLVPGGRHMAVNLAGVPVLNHHHAADGLQYIVDQTVTLHGFLGAAPGGSSSLTVGTTPTCPSTTCGIPNEHCWRTMDLAGAVSWLSARSLDVAPLVGEILADRDGRWGSIDVQLGASGAFGAVRYSVSTPQGGPAVVELLGRENLDRIELDGSAYGLHSQSGITLRTDSVDGTPSTIVLRGMNVAPFSVLRNGLPVTGTCTGTGAPGWCYDAASAEVRLLETEGATATWEIL